MRCRATWWGTDSRSTPFWRSSAWTPANHVRYVASPSWTRSRRLTACDRSSAASGASCFSTGASTGVDNEEESAENWCKIIHEVAQQRTGRDFGEVHPPQRGGGRANVTPVRKPLKRGCGEFVVPR